MSNQSFLDLDEKWIKEMLNSLVFKNSVGQEFKGDGTISWTATDGKDVKLPLRVVTSTLVPKDSYIFVTKEGAWQTVKLENTDPNRLYNLEDE